MKNKYMLIVIITGLIMAISLTTSANTIYEKYTAIARPDYKIIVDGQEVTLKTPPKTIEGATHLPIRELADILGKEVTFKDGTIELNSKINNEGDNMSTIKWVPLRDVAVSYGLQVGKTSDSNGMFRVTKNDLIYFEFNPLDLIDVDHVEIRAYNDSMVTIKLEDSHYYIDESDVSVIFQ